MGNGKKKRKKSDEPGWVNADLLKMAESLEQQAQDISDEEDYHEPRRHDLRDAAIHIRQAFQSLAKVSDTHTRARR